MDNNQNQKPNFYTLYQKVGNIEGKLDEALKTLSKHEDRINCVERITDQFVGKTSLFGSIAGFIGGIIVTCISYFIKNK